MTDDAETQRIIGQLQATADNLQVEVRELRKQVSALVELVATARGGWRTLLAVGAAAASVGAGIATLLNWIRHT
jgi:hypothetical protein